MSFSFDVNENSYATGMAITIAGGGNCSSLTTTDVVDINTGTENITINI